MSDSELRQRNVPSQDSKAEPSAQAPAKPAAAQRSGGIGVLDVIRVLLGVALISSVASYFVTGNSFVWNMRPQWTRPNRIVAIWYGYNRTMTAAELAKYDGTNKWLPIYIGVNGSIYDVSASPHFYGPGGGYNVFAGKDSTRSFISGCFDEDWTPDLRGVEEIYMPKDLDVAPKLPDEAGAAEKAKAKKLWKLRRQRAAADGKAKVQQTIAHWSKMFDGGPGGKYFKIGHIKLPDDWKEKRGGLRNLCKRAAEQRPETNKWSSWTEEDDK